MAGAFQLPLHPTGLPVDPFGGPDPIVQETMLLRAALRLLGRHKLLFWSLAFIVTVGGLGLTVVLPPKYQASSTVLVEASRREAVSLRDVLSDTPADSEAIASELELLTSREMLERISIRLNLADDPEFVPAPRLVSFEAIIDRGRAALPDWLPSLPVSHPAAQPMSDVIDAVRRNLLVAPVGRSRVIRMTFVSRDPRTSAAVVNALADAYVAEHLRLRQEAAREANSWIDDHMVQLRDRADASTRAVEAYRSGHGLIRGRDSLLVQQEISDVNSQLTAARMRRSETGATLADAQRSLQFGRPEMVAGVLNSSLIQRLREQEAQLTARRADVAARTGDSHPAAIAIGAELRDVQARIGAEVNRILQSTRDAEKIAQANETALVERLQVLRKQVDEANAEDVGLQALQREAGSDNALYQAFLTRSKETDPQLSFPTVNFRVMSRAVPPSHPFSPNRPLLAGASVLLGLITGSVAAFGRDRMTKGLRTRDEVERLVGTPLLGLIPFYRKRTQPLASAMLEEATASLWVRLMVSGNGPAPRSLLITSAVPREGKTTLSRLLSITAAERGQRVLVVDADLRRSSLSGEILPQETRPGLVDIVSGGARIEDLVVRVQANVDILPAGSCKGSPVHLLASRQFTEFLRKAEADYDLVILDSPPVLIGADAWLLGCNAQGTVLLARWGSTSSAAVTAALRQLADVRARCLGLVLSIVDTHRHAQYDDTVSVPVSRLMRRYYAKLAGPG